MTCQGGLHWLSIVSSYKIKHYSCLYLSKFSIYNLLTIDVEGIWNCFGVTNQLKWGILVQKTGEGAEHNTIMLRGAWVKQSIQLPWAERQRKRWGLSSTRDSMWRGGWDCDHFLVPSLHYPPAPVFMESLFLALLLKYGQCVPPHSPFIISFSSFCPLFIKHFNFHGNNNFIILWYKIFVWN